MNEIQVFSYWFSLLCWKASQNTILNEIPLSEFEIYCWRVAFSFFFVNFIFELLFTIVQKSASLKKMGRRNQQYEETEEPVMDHEDVGVEHGKWEHSLCGCCGDCETSKPLTLFI